MNLWILNVQEGKLNVINISHRFIVKMEVISSLSYSSTNKIG